MVSYFQSQLHILDDPALCMYICSPFQSSATASFVWNWILNPLNDFAELQSAHFLVVFGVVLCVCVYVCNLCLLTPSKIS